VTRAYQPFWALKAQLPQQLGSRADKPLQRLSGGPSRLTEDGDHRHAASPNILDRVSEASAPNQTWIAAFAARTFGSPTYEGAGLAAVRRIIDLCSRSVVGWSMSRSG